MISVKDALQTNQRPLILAQAVLSEYFCGKQVTYPINPFQMLTDFGVPFVFRTFSDKKLEGMYLPAQDDDDVPVVGINIKRPITRQRFTAAHELCHHIKDSRSSQVCDLGSTSPVEKYADAFAAELLMPRSEMKRQIQNHASQGYLSLDDVLEISEYFGVSFQSCLFRAAYVFHKIDGDCNQKSLNRKASHYHVKSQREKLGYVDTPLYEQLIDAAEPWLQNIPSREFIKAKYCNDYIFNDSRLEGVDIEAAKVAEIVTDIRLHGADSPYCTETHKKEIEIAGHACMYEDLFSINREENIDIYTLLRLHEKLYSCAPAPEFGGKLRVANPLVLGAKFETVDWHDVGSAILELRPTVEALLNYTQGEPLSEFIEQAAKLHHRLTVIHPFADGNGRTTRGFLNLLFMHRGLPPIYIKAAEKEEYRCALARADMEEDFNNLYEVIFKALLRAQAELTEAPML